MSDGFMFYPSGFIGTSQVPLTKPLDPAIAERTSRSVNAIVEPNLMGGNGDVQALWDAVCAGEPRVSSFEFRERILQVAKPAFGTTSLYEWLVSQVNSPTFSPYHADYLNETLEFALYGVKRRLSYNNWVVLLAPNHAMPPTTVPRTLQEWTTDRYQRGGMTVTSLIACWVSQERGIVDLLESLFVLFGKR
jgi:hypothetical protein